MRSARSSYRSRSVGSLRSASLNASSDRRRRWARVWGAGPGGPAGRWGAGGTLRAVGAAILGAGIWIGFAGPLSVTLGLNITWGLVAVAAFIGWLIGSATRSGAHGAEPRPSAPSVRAIAVGGALFAWLAALVGGYLSR